MGRSWGLGGFQRRGIPEEEPGSRGTLPPLRSGAWSRPPRRAPAHLVVRPAGLPDAQRLGLGELALEAEQEPAVAEEHLQAVLAQRDQVLIEAQVCQPQQLPQVQLG